jgi:hypothetical protein
MPTFTQIGSAVTVGSGGAANIDFTSIPSTYTDLVIKLCLRDTSTGDPAGNVCNISFNGSTSGFTGRILFGEGSGSGGSTTVFPRVIATIPTSASGSTASTFGNAEVYIPNYAGSTNKSYSSDAVTERNATASYMYLVAGLWSNTAAINQITIAPNSGSFVQHSTAYLYGVSNA